VKITETQTRRNREMVVAKASKLFRERGVDGLSVNDLMKAAGFTHGGFYNHFKSKAALAAEAFDHAFRTMDAERERAATLDQLILGYLSEEARNAPGSTCAAAALANDAARQPKAIKQVFAEGLDRMIGSVADRFPDATSDARGEAVDLVCRMLGALVLARAVPASSELGSELLTTTKSRCRESVAALVQSAERHTKLASKPG
jgi:TetR/AcrR family transcriptional repressor of nem operon